MIDLGHELVVAAEDFAGMIQSDLGSIQQAMRFGQALDGFGRELIALQRDHVDAARPGRMSLDQHERRHVVQHSAQAADEAVAADRGVMVHGHGAGERGMIVDVHVPAQQRAVGDHDVVAQFAVVGHVAAGHEEVVVPDGGDAVFFFAAAIDRHAFADQVVIADRDLRVGAAVADVLRFAADDHAGINVVVLADGDVAHERDVVLQPRAAADPDIRPDDAERPDFDIGVDFGSRMDRDVFGNEPCHRLLLGQVRLAWIRCL